MSLAQEAAAVPCYVGDTILDGAEDAQVVVMQGGIITEYALSQERWRLFFGLATEVSASTQSGLAAEDLSNTTEKGLEPN